MAVSTSMQKTVYYMGEMEYDKKWLSDTVIEADIQNDDAEKLILLSAVKQAFDSQVYIGPRCENTGCVTKGRCPVNRRLGIIILGKKSTMETMETMETTEKGWYSIMIHAYKTGDGEETVFDELIDPADNQLQIELNAWKGSQNRLKGYFAEVKDAQLIAGVKDIMKKAQALDCTADVMAFKSEDYCVQS